MNNKVIINKRSNNIMSIILMKKEMVMMVRMKLMEKEGKIEMNMGFDMFDDFDSWGMFNYEMKINVSILDIEFIDIEKIDKNLRNNI